MTDADRAAVLRAQRLRWEFLRELYRANQTVPAGQLQSVHAAEIGQGIGLTDQGELQQVWKYLCDAGLLELISMGPHVAITRRGIDEFEEAVRHPDRKTAHMPPLNVVQNIIVGDVHGPVQQGTTRSQQTVTTTTSTVDWEGLWAILQEIRAGAEQLPPDQRQEVFSDIETVEAQSRSPRPKPGVINMALRGLGVVVANTAGNIAAAPLIHWIELHHWFLG